jgi:hypothetical protein
VVVFASARAQGAQITEIMLEVIVAPQPAGASWGAPVILVNLAVRPYHLESPRDPRKRPMCRPFVARFTAWDGGK